MTRQRYEILCCLRTEAHTVAELQAALSIPHNKTAVMQSISLRNASLIAPRGSRTGTGKTGPKPLLYVLTQRGEAAIQKARVALAVKDRTIIDLDALEVAE